MGSGEDHFNFLGDLIGRAQTAGADTADAVYVKGISLSLACRLGEIEQLEHSEGADLGLRVFKGRRQAIVSSSDTSLSALNELVTRAIAMVGSVPEDPFCGIADTDQVASNLPETLDIIDPAEPSTDALKMRAVETEESARSVSGITNSEGAEASWGRSSVFLATSNGFQGMREATQSSLSVSVLAGKGTAMERDYEYASAVYSDDLPTPVELGNRAGEQAVARLNPRKIGSSQSPIFFAPRVSRSIITHLSDAINGAAVARGTSFLIDKMGKQIFPESITIIDDPLRARGLRSKQFDGEGLQATRQKMVDRGELKSWLLNLRSARQLELPPSSHASRGTSSPPGIGVSNFFMEAGAFSPVELMADVGEGLLVTELIGQGINYVTGDYSRGASGFWLENGEISFPVSEITIAGNLCDMFQNITAADDLEFRYGIDAPTLRIDGMTIAGK